MVSRKTQVKTSFIVLLVIISLLLPLAVFAISNISNFTINESVVVNISFNESNISNVSVNVTFNGTNISFDVEKISEEVAVQPVETVTIDYEDLRLPEGDAPISVRVDKNSCVTLQKKQLSQLNTVQVHACSVDKYYESWDTLLEQHNVIVGGVSP